MNAALQSISLVSRISIYCCFLSLATLFATLRAAYALTGRAGIKRLCEKYPQSQTRIESWIPRWNLLRISLLLWAVLMNVATIVSSLMLFISTREAWLWLEVTGISAFSTLILTLMLYILPQALSEGFSDRISVLFLPMTTLLSLLSIPVAWPLAKLEEKLKKRMITASDDEDRPTPEEAIRSLVDEKANLDLEEEERDIIRSVFEFGETVVREIMVPRVAVEGIEDTGTIDQCTANIHESHHSRYPVFHESLDDIRGSVHVKDILHSLALKKGSQRITSITKTIPFVPESMPINDLLQLLRAEQSQMAVVVDEYGGTAGMVTMEDIIEELVGDIQDEYDVDEGSAIHRLSDGSSIINARMPADEVNDVLSIHIPLSEEYDSIGGFACSALGHIPRPGETVDGSDFQLTIQSATEKQILSVRVQPHHTAAGPA